MKLRIIAIRKIISWKEGTQSPLRELIMKSKNKKSLRKRNQWQATKNSWSLTISTLKSTIDLYLKEWKVFFRQHILMFKEGSLWILPLKSSNNFLNKRPNRKENVFKGCRTLSVTAREPSIKSKEVPVSRNPSRSTAMWRLKVSPF
jgi:hypothetical protein